MLQIGHIPLVYERTNGLYELDTRSGYMRLIHDAGSVQVARPLVEEPDDETYMRLI